MKISRIIALLKREWWENKAQWIRGVVVMISITTIVTLVGIAYMNYSSFSLNPQQAQDAEAGCFPQVPRVCVFDHGTLKVNFGALLKNDSIYLGWSVLRFVYWNCMLVSIMMAIILSIYVLKSLYDDRAKKDILFWRSLPFSETENVITKALVVILAFPLVVFVANIVADVIGLLIAIGWGAYFGLPFSKIIAGLSQQELLTVPWIILWDNLMGMLTILPIIGFALFCSAASKKSPALPAFLLPAALGVIHWGMMYMLQSDPIVTPIVGWYGDFLIKTKATFVLYMPFVFELNILLPLLLSIAIGTGFLAATVWCRNNRYEI